MTESVSFDFALTRCFSCSKLLHFSSGNNKSTSTRLAISFNNYTKQGSKQTLMDPTFEILKNAGNPTTQQHRMKWSQIEVELKRSGLCVSCGTNTTVKRSALGIRPKSNHSCYQDNLCLPCYEYEKGKRNGHPHSPVAKKHKFRQEGRDDEGRSGSSSKSVMPTNNKPRLVNKVHSPVGAESSPRLQLNCKSVSPTQRLKTSVSLNTRSKSCPRYLTARGRPDQQGSKSVPIKQSSWFASNQKLHN